MDGRQRRDPPAPVPLPLPGSAAAFPPGGGPSRPVPSRPLRAPVRARGGGGWEGTHRAGAERGGSPSGVALGVPSRTPGTGARAGAGRGPGGEPGGDPAPMESFGLGGARGGGRWEPLKGGSGGGAPAALTSPRGSAGSRPAPGECRGRGGAPRVRPSPPARSAPQSASPRRPRSVPSPRAPQRPLLPVGSEISLSPPAAARVPRAPLPPSPPAWRCPGVGVGPVVPRRVPAGGGRVSSHPSSGNNGRALRGGEPRRRVQQRLHRGAVHLQHRARLQGGRCHQGRGRGDTHGWHRRAAPLGAHVPTPPPCRRSGPAPRASPSARRGTSPAWG